MRFRGLRASLIVAVVAGMGSAAAADYDPAVTISCTKLSDNTLRVEAQAELLDYMWYQWSFSDGTHSVRAFEQNTADHTFTGITQSSFPLFLSVQLYLDEQTPEPYGHTSAVVDCCHLFAPELTVLVGSKALPNGGTHDAGLHAPGTVQLRYTVDNTQGMGDLIVDGVSASSPANCHGFTVDTPLPLTVEDGATGTLRVSVALSDPGAFGFELSISSNDPETDPYSFDVSGTVMTPEQAALGGASQQLVPLGQGGEDIFLDCPPVLDEAGDPVLVGYLPLAGVYPVGEPMTGAAMVRDAAGAALRSAWIYAHVYAVDLGTRPTSSELLESWMIRFDPESGDYPLSWDTEGMAPGIYDIYLSIGSLGTGQTLRVQLVEPGI